MHFYKKRSQCRGECPLLDPSSVNTAQDWLNLLSNKLFHKYFRNLFIF